jgi:hypothetical protein
MTGNVVRSEVDALMLCRTKHGRNTRVLWEISCRTNRDRYTRIQLYAALKAENRRGREVSVLCENTRPRDQSINQAGRTSHCCIGTPITRPRS